MSEMDQGRIVFGKGPTTQEEEITEAIRRRAKEIWEAEGCRPGDEEECRRRAEQELKIPRDF